MSYSAKHNEANGEGNRDGIDENLSWNCGVEGPSNDPAIQALRTRQTKNFFTILLLSRGVPMLLGGDEIRRTQGGNNNAYNQDNVTSWFDWTMVESNWEAVHRPGAQHRRPCERGLIREEIGFRRLDTLLRKG